MVGRCTIIVYARVVGIAVTTDFCISDFQEAESLWKQARTTCFFFFFFFFFLKIKSTSQNKAVAELW